MAGRIEHTLLGADATLEQIDRLCAEAMAFGFWAVCVHPIHVTRAADRLRAASSDSGLRCPAIVSVAGFPLGGSATATKADEARRALGDGATEIDMVARLGALIAGDGAAVQADIQAVADVVHQAAPEGALKVILETGALTDEQIALGCRCCVAADADFVKTSTGFHRAGGARVEHVRLLCRYAAPLKVKASGGIRDAATARAMIEAGAARIGTSNGPAIMQGL